MRPSQAGIMGNVGSVRACGDALLGLADNGGPIAAWAAGGFGPCLTAIAGQSDVVRILFRFGVFAAYCDAVFGVAEEQGEDSRRFGIVADGRLGDGPGGAAVLCMEDARAAGAEPCFLLAADAEA